MAESPQGNPGAEQARLPDLFLKAVKAAIIGTDLSGIVNFGIRSRKSCMGGRQKK